MHLKLVTIALAFIGVPMALHAAPKPPAETAQPHPSPSAHANAVAGEASAARIEGCVHATKTLLRDLEQHDGTAAAANFSARLKGKVGAPQLDGLWAHITSETGQLQARGTPQNAMFQQDVVILLPLRFERTSLNFQVACNEQGQVDGFFLRPVAPPPSASPATSG